MVIRVDLSVEPPGVSLDHPEDCGRLHVEVVSGDDLELVDRALIGAGLGRVCDEGHALVEVIALRSLAEGRVGSGWLEEFNAMLSYAQSKGWVTPDGAEIRAHLERVAW